MARWIVDGMNVIGTRPDGWWRDRAAAVRRLTDAMVEWQSATGEPVMIVYDGRPVDVASDPDRGVEVVFAARRGPNAADDEIVRRIAADDDPRDMRVVTSDDGLAARLRPYGVQIVPAGRFRRELDEIARSPRS
jgi:predicted RNA-binding protein with PIN domain